MAAKNLKELWGLLFEDPESLTDEQIESILGAREELKEKLDRLWNFPYQIECVQCHRQKKKELSGKPTKELLYMRKNIQDERSRLLRSRSYKVSGDSLLEWPHTGSDELVLKELLRERGAS